MDQRSPCPYVVFLAQAGAHVQPGVWSTWQSLCDKLVGDPWTQSDMQYALQGLLSLGLAEQRGDGPTDIRLFPVQGHTLPEVATAPPASAPASAPAPEEIICSRCGKNHLDELCPDFKDLREDHKDGWENFGKIIEIGKPAGDIRLTGADIEKQPRDGNCCYHSMAYGQFACCIPVPPPMRERKMV